MTVNSPKKVILEAYSEYDALLNYISGNVEKSKIMNMLFDSVRLSYACRRIDKRELLLMSVIRIVKALLVGTIYKYYIASNGPQTVILDDYYTEDNLIVSNLTNIPIAKIKRKISLNTNGIGGFILTLRVLCLVRKYDGKINKNKLLALIPQMLYFFYAYSDFDFGDISKIITSTDADGESYAAIAKAKREGIKTIKIDHHLIDNIHHNKIYCDIYYCPNSYCMDLLKPFNLNKIIIIGGYPKFDILENNKQINKALKKITVSYFTQHSYLLIEQISYIKDIIDFIGNKDSFRIIIKLHRYDTNDYTKFMLPNVEIRDSEADIYQIIAESDYTFSISSTVTLEAKHICEKSYFIHYDSEIDTGIVDFSAFKGIIDIVNCKDMLHDVIFGQHKPIGKEKFIEEFNPAYPNACAKLLNI